MKRKKYTSGQATIYGLIGAAIGGSINYFLLVLFYTLTGSVEYMGMYPALLSAIASFVLFFGVRQAILSIEEEGQDLPPEWTR